MLIATIHDVAPPTLAAVDQLRAALAGWGVDAVTLLAVPDYHRRAPLASCPRTATWLRAAADRGDEVALHGVIHRQDAPVAARRDRLRARLFTAGEGEMLGAGADDRARLAAARAQLAELLGRDVAGFVAPAWLERAGLGDRLAEVGFAWHETAWVIEGLTPRRRVRAPVIGFATRTRWRERAALAWAAALTPLLAIAAPVVRVAVHPADLTSAAVMAALERVVRQASRDRRAVTTAAALAAPAATPRHR